MTVYVTDPITARMLPLLEVKLHQNVKFLWVTETLTRVGKVSGKELVQVCFLLHKKGRLYLTHHKELLALDGVLTEEISDDDIHEKLFCAGWLLKWDLIDIVEVDLVPAAIEASHDRSSGIMIIKHADRFTYMLRSPYEIGKRK